MQEKPELITKTKNNEESSLVFYYNLSKLNKEEEKENVKRRLQIYYPNIIFIDLPNTFPFAKPLESLRNNTNNKIVIVLDKINELSEDLNTFVKYYTNLYRQNIYLSFFRYPFLDTENIVKLCKELSSTMNLSDISSFDKLVEMTISAQLNIFIKNKILLSKERRNNIFHAAEKGFQIGKTPGRKASAERIKNIKDIICRNSSDFDGTLSDVNVMKLLNQDDKTKIARNSFYRYKREIKASLCAA